MKMDTEQQFNVFTSLMVIHVVMGRMIVPALRHLLHVLPWQGVACWWRAVCSVQEGSFSKPSTSR